MFDIFFFYHIGWCNLSSGTTLVWKNTVLLRRKPFMVKTGKLTSKDADVFLVSAKTERISLYIITSVCKRLQTWCWKGLIPQKHFINSASKAAVKPLKLWTVTPFWIQNIKAAAKHVCKRFDRKKRRFKDGENGFSWPAHFLLSSASPSFWISWMMRSSSCCRKTQKAASWCH